MTLIWLWGHHCSVLVSIWLMTVRIVCGCFTRLRTGQVSSTASNNSLMVSEDAGDSTLRAGNADKALFCLAGKYPYQNLFRKMLHKLFRKFWGVPTSKMSGNMKMLSYYSVLCECGVLGMADGVGFEPTRRLHACRFSRPVPSTARPPIPDHISFATGKTWITKMPLTSIT